MLTVSPYCLSVTYQMFVVNFECDVMFFTVYTNTLWISSLWFPKSVSGGEEEKEKEESEKEPKMSKNAQFRAIQPSPSILSFVEKNVICMSREFWLLCWLCCFIVIVNAKVCWLPLYYGYYLQLLGRRRTIDLRRAGYNIDLSAPLDNIPFSSNSEREKIEENVRSCLRQ